MNHFKKISFLSFTLFLTVLIINQNKEEKKDEPVEQSWTTFYIDQSQEVKSYESTPEELDKIASGETKAPARIPASKKEPQEKSSHYPTSYQVKDKQKKQLVSRLLSFQEKGTKILIKPEKTIHKKVGDQVNIYEKVIITYLFENNIKGFHSFNALIDQDTGKIVRTWNQSIHEPLRGHRSKRELTPTGTL